MFTFEKKQFGVKQLQLSDSWATFMKALEGPFSGACSAVHSR